MRLLLLIAAAQLLSAGDNAASQPVDNSTSFAWSQAVLAVSLQADLASSRHHIELNPLLGRGDFGTQQIVVGEAVLAAVLIAEHFAVKRHRGLAKKFLLLNYTLSAGHSGLAVHNWRLHR